MSACAYRTETTRGGGSAAAAAAAALGGGGGGEAILTDRRWSGLFIYFIFFLHQGGACAAVR